VKRTILMIMLTLLSVAGFAFDWGDWYNGYPWSMNVWENLKVTDIGTQNILIHQWQDLQISPYSSVNFEYKKPGFYEPWIYLYSMPSDTKSFWHKWEFPTDGMYYIRLVYYDSDSPEGITLAQQRVLYKKAWFHPKGRMNPW